jgi:uncharacterized membrane protein
MATSKTRHPFFSKTRMEALSDGVFAVAMTLLVVDVSTIGLPKLDHAWWPEFWPKAVSFVYSFIVVAVYWVIHHNEMNLIRGTTREFNWLNLFFLLFIVLIPFSAALLGNNWFLSHSLEPGHYWYIRIPMFTYSANLILASISLQAAWWYASRREYLLSDVNSVVRRTFARNFIIPVATVLVLLVALWSVDVGQSLLVLIPLSYALWTLWAAHKVHEERERYEASHVATSRQSLGSN